MAVCESYTHTAAAAGAAGDIHSMGLQSFSEKHLGGMKVNTNAQRFH